MYGPYLSPELALKDQSYLNCVINDELNLYTFVDTVPPIELLLLIPLIVV